MTTDAKVHGGLLPAGDGLPGLDDPTSSTLPRGQLNGLRTIDGSIRDVPDNDRG